jgi:peroxiredoxin
MRSDIAPGGVFPDYALPDQTGAVRRLSELQGRDPLILMLRHRRDRPPRRQRTARAGTRSAPLHEVEQTTGLRV